MAFFAHPGRYTDWRRHIALSICILGPGGVRLPGGDGMIKPEVQVDRVADVGEPEWARFLPR